MKDHAKKTIGTLLRTILGAISGIALGVVAVYFAGFIPFLLDAIHHPDLDVVILGLYCLAVIAVALSAAARFVGLLLSQRIRGLVVIHPIAHAVWFAAGFGVILGLIIYLTVGFLAI